MKQALILLLLTLAISLGAIVNLGDEYIGLTPMGQFRKLSQSQSSHNYDGPSYGSTSYYYYNEFIPTRLDSILTYSTGDFDDYGTNLYYEYAEFDGYHQVTETCYRWHVGQGCSLLYVCVYKYDHQDRILEYHRTANYQNINVNRILYSYDERGNLVLQAEYKTNVSETIPYRVTTTQYDAQNRAVNIRVVANQELRQTTWHTWSNHSLPDSTHIINNDPDALYRQESHRRLFDDNGEMYYTSSICRFRGSGSWVRSDKYILYTIAHGMAFPITIYEAGNYLDDPNDPFIPPSATLLNYQYNDDYHTIISGSDTSPYKKYDYDDNWLLTQYYCNHGYGVSSKSITWEYYGSTPNDDPTAVPQAVVTAYPNPARGSVNISLNKGDVKTPVEAKVYNIRGQLVRRLEVSDTRGDQYLYNWDCKDRNNRAVPSGVYLIRIKTSSGEVNKKVTVIK